MRKPIKREAPPLTFIPPMLPTLVDEPPEGGEWIHEIKYDGWRAQIVIQDGMAKVFTRNGHDWTEKFWPIAEAAETLSTFTAIVDGWIIITGMEGKPDFHALRQAIKIEPRRLVFVAFDLLLWNGRDLRDRTLLERRKALWSLACACRRKDPVQPSCRGRGPTSSQPSTR